MCFRAKNQRSKYNVQAGMHNIMSHYPSLDVLMKRKDITFPLTSQSPESIVTCQSEVLSIALRACYDSAIMYGWSAA